MTAIIEQTNRYITKEEAEKLQQLFFLASRTPVYLTTKNGLDSSLRDSKYRKLQEYMLELAERYELSIEKDGAVLKIGEGNELIYAIVD